MNDDTKTTNDGSTDDDLAAGADVVSPESFDQTDDGANGELEQLRDRLLRTQAELENFRKRSRKEADDERRYRDMSLLRDLLPIVDNLQRAMEAAGQSPDASGLLEGVKIVADQLQGVFQAHDCREIAALGATFDPNFHEAILQQSSDEYPAGTVTLVSQVGYQLHDRVVRPAQVIVSSGPATGE